MGHGLIFTAMKARPLSPHLQIYRPQISSTISIFHRAAGLALIAGLVIAACLLVAAATSPECYAQLLEYGASPLGQGVLLGLTLCFFFYFLAELRYLGWAFGYGFSLPVMNVTGWLVSIGSIALTALVWM